MESSLTGVPLGAWEFDTGRWHYNTNLSMSRSDQLAHNVKHGYCCACGYAVGKCRRCGERLK